MRTDSDLAWLVGLATFLSSCFFPSIVAVIFIDRLAWRALFIHPGMATYTT